MLDIIIPVLNEEVILLQEVQYFHSLRKQAKVIFVDGGSRDRTVEIAQSYGKVLISKPGRAIQKNLGVLGSKAPYLLFLHVDSCISLTALIKIKQVFNRGAVGGCLSMHIQDKGFIFRLYERAVNFRAKMFGVIDGDLGMFIRRDVFNELGQFDLVPVMEDFVFARKLRKRSKIHVLSDRIYVSGRKWRERGFMHTFFEYTRAHFQLWSGQLTHRKSNFTPHSKIYRHPVEL